MNSNQQFQINCSTWTTWTSRTIGNLLGNIRHCMFLPPHFHQYILHHHKYLLLLLFLSVFEALKVAIILLRKSAENLFCKDFLYRICFKTEIVGLHTWQVFWKHVNHTDFCYSLPELHVFVHPLHSCQPPQIQLTAQHWVLHSRDSLNGSGQIDPPQLDVVWIALERVCSPPSHVAEHESKLLQGPNLQSTGQQPVLQERKSLVEPMQDWPPQLASVFILLTRTRVPPPHCCEHIPKLLHCPQTQSTGSLWQNSDDNDEP